MRAHWLQHVPFEGLGYIEIWLTATGYEVTQTKLFQSEVLPELDAFDLLIAMGGPMSVNDEAEYPWLADEKRFVRNAINAGKPVLGICLGAQLIASALGARVYKNTVKEIGWFPIEKVCPSEKSAFAFPPSLEVFHWHGETFELPTGAHPLAKSIGCEHQAFQLGDTVIGLQFHLETTLESACQIVANCRDELVTAQYIQTEEEILSASLEKYEAINQVLKEVLEYLHYRMKI